MDAPGFPIHNSTVRLRRGTSVSRNVLVWLVTRLGTSRMNYEGVYGLTLPDI